MDFQKNLLQLVLEEDENCTRELTCVLEKDSEFNLIKSVKLSGGVQKVVRDKVNEMIMEHLKY